MIMITPRVMVSTRRGTIDVAWANQKLAKACATDKAGNRHWGADRWPLLRRRLAALIGAPTLQAMDGAPGRCHALTGDRVGAFAIALWGAGRLVFEPDHDPVPRLGDGGIDRAMVTRIRIVEVVDYHGE
jgi:toxin HigB-1